jgi:hypothetical protein
MTRMVRISQIIRDADAEEVVMIIICEICVISGKPTKKIPFF